jgi:hypothetical protein
MLIFCITTAMLLINQDNLLTALLFGCMSFCTVIVTNQSKTVTLHAMVTLGGGEEVYLLLIHDLGTSWGEWSASRPGRALPPGKGPPVLIVQEAGWASEQVWTQMLEEKSFAPAGDRTSIARLSSP